MEFSDENLEQSTLDKELHHIEEQGYKKYVVKINNKFVSLIDDMSVDERNSIINDILETYREQENEKRQTRFIKGMAIKILITIFVMLFVVPFIFLAINKALNVTSKNYKEMQNNFQTLYDNSYHSKKQKRTGL
ncbi:MAG: hypothetical protein PHX18_00525 [Candidatus Gastranaerophilales bacterium]|nr:hypothetical protein [Candidatus Gastranaerophilales bacterium]